MMQGEEEGRSWSSGQNKRSGLPPHTHSNAGLDAGLASPLVVMMGGDVETGLGVGCGWRRRMREKGKWFEHFLFIYLISRQCIHVKLELDISNKHMSH